MVLRCVAWGRKADSSINEMGGRPAPKLPQQLLKSNHIFLAAPSITVSDAAAAHVGQVAYAASLVSKLPPETVANAMCKLDMLGWICNEMDVYDRLS